jgi:hypothetical protein
MKISELLRNLADLVDIESDAAKAAALAEQPDTSDEPSEAIQPNTVSDSSLAIQPDDIFVPPLQLKIELLKKATGVESIYSDEKSKRKKNKKKNKPTDKKFANSYDELEVIKKNAGMSPVIMDSLADDEPLDV